MMLSFAVEITEATELRTHLSVISVVFVAAESPRPSSDFAARMY